jgi:hypothetical protein
MAISNEERLTEALAEVATLDPVAMSAAGTTDYAHMRYSRRIVFTLLAGDIPAGVTALNFKLVSGSLTGGTADPVLYSADISGKTITCTAGTIGKNLQYHLEITDAELNDHAGTLPARQYVAAVVTPSGGGTMLAAVSAKGSVARYHPASDRDLASVTQIVA